MAMSTQFKAFPRRQVQLLDGELKRRFDVNRFYLMSLSSDSLLFNHRLEAVLANSFRNEPLHGGWEAPSCQLRGHFLGHWLSAAARIFAATGDEQIKACAAKGGIIAPVSWGPLVLRKAQTAGSNVLGQR